MYKTLIPLLIALIINSVFGQDYFPLQVGNVWYQYSYPKYIEEIVEIDSVNYYKYCSPWNCFYYRKDTLGNIIGRSLDSEESLIYKLGGDVGDSWYNEGYLKFVLTLESKTDTVIIRSDTLYNCYRITARGINVIDADNSIWFAPDLGIVKTKSLDWGTGSYLLKAMVNGTKFPSYEIPLEIIETIPDNGLSGIPVDSEITLIFNFALKSNFINPNYIKIKDKQDIPIQGTLTEDYNNSKYRVRFFPDSLFPFRDTIYVSIYSGIEDFVGDHLANDYALTFITEGYYQEPELFVIDTISTFPLYERATFDWGDFGNDYDQDLLIFRTMDSLNVGRFHVIEIYQNNNGEFEKYPTNLKPIQTDHAELGDVKWVDYNNDNALDIVITWQNISHQSITTFYKNRGGDFDIDPSMTINIGNRSMDWGDYDLDGYEDLALWGFSKDVSTSLAAVYKNDHGNLTQLEVAGLPFGSSGKIKWIDFNNDGAKDLITFGRQLNKIGFYENINNNLIKVDLEILDRNWLPYSYNIDYTDLEKDGDIDLLIGNYLLIRDEDSFVRDTIQIEFLSTSSVKFIDYDQDSDMDLFVIGTKDDIVNRKRTFFQIYQNRNGELLLFQETNLNKNIHIASSQWVDIDKDGLVDLTLMSDNHFLVFYSMLDFLDITQMLLPTQYYIFQNFPNPFNPVTTIRYELPQYSHVRLSVYDILGREVAVLTEGFQPSGFYNLQWNAASVPSGIYFVQMIARDFRQVRKVMVLK